MTSDGYYVVWFDRGQLYTFVDSANDPLVLSREEVNEDLDGVIVSEADATAAIKANDYTKRYGITDEALALHFGVFL